MSVEWNQTETSYPRDQMLHALIEAHVQRSPDACAVVFENRQLTYRQLNDRASEIAQQLQSLGVGPNTLVAICVERSLEMLVGLLGILRAGGAYVPMDPAYPIDRLAFMLEDCQPLVLLTQKHLQSRFPAHHGYTVLLDAEPVATETFPLRRESQPDDLAYVLYTSGSTGKPKGVRVANNSLINLLCAMQREPGLTSTDTLLAVTTLSFDIAGLELFLPLIGGARVLIASRETAMDGARLAALIQQSGATVMQATPATWRMLLDSGWSGSQSLKILCGGEAWSAALAAELLPRCKSLWNMYGPTETTIWSAVSRVEAGKAVLIGYPIANTTFHVLDAARELVPIGVPGELHIGGEGVAQGYHKRPELTEERFVPDPFSAKPGARLYKTGDLVRRLPDKQMEFLRRMDQQVKIRGFRIELEEVEAALRQHPSISECVVSVREAVSGGKQLVAHIVCKSPRFAPAATELRSFLKEKLPDYMVPTSFSIVEAFPLTPNGKLDRKALASRSLVQKEPARKTVAPSSVLEMAVKRIWEQILGTQVESVQDSFFDLGGTSLQAAQMFAEIEKTFNVKLPLSTLFEAPAIEDIVRILKVNATSSGWSCLVPIQPLGSRPPFFCFHGAGGNVLLYQKLSQYLGKEQPFFGLQSQGLDGSSPLLATIEEMAALYVKQIRRVQPCGPYMLGGYCLGGTIAYEAAQQLRVEGEEVALLALFDTVNWHKVSSTFWNNSTLFFERLLFHALILAELDTQSKKAFLRTKFHELRKRLPVWKAVLLNALTKRPMNRTPSSNLLGQVWLTNQQASRDYVPQPYPGTVTDFRPSTQYKALSKPDLKWDDLAAGGQRVVVISTYPAAMLVEPYVRDLAAMLANCIDDVIRRESMRAEKVPA